MHLPAPPANGEKNASVLRSGKSPCLNQNPCATCSTSCATNCAATTCRAYGHAHLHTPNIDRLATAGVRFSRAYTQGTICGPSRMSAYTGRYVSSHQVAWNAVPLPLEELTIGDYLRPHGIRTALVGKDPRHAQP